MKLSTIILEQDATHEYKVASDKLADEIKRASGEDRVFVDMGAYSDLGPKREKGYGKVTFIKSDTVNPTAFKQVINLLTAKGFEITEEGNWYDEDEDRRYYPTIKFEFDI